MCGLPQSSILIQASLGSIYYITEAINTRVMQTLQVNHLQGSNILCTKYILAYILFYKSPAFDNSILIFLFQFIEMFVTIAFNTRKLNIVFMIFVSLCIFSLFFLDLLTSIIDRLLMFSSWNEQFSGQIEKYHTQLCH